MHNPSLSRKDVYEDILPRVITADLNDDERFFLGEVYFFTLMPEEARDAYYPLRLGNSMRARVAWQRLLQIRFRAFQMHDRVRREMKQFRETFAPDPADRTYMATQVVNFGRMYAEQGRHADVVDVVEEELAALDYSGAYGSLALPATFIESYTEEGKVDLALTRLRAARDGLSDTLAKRLEAPHDDDHRYLLPGERLAFFFSPVTEKLGWSQQNDKFRQLIARLDDAIGEIEAGGA